MVDTLKEIPFALKFLIVIIITFGISVILTPIMTFVSKAIGAVDKPNERRVNKKPRFGHFHCFCDCDLVYSATYCS